MQYTLLVLLNYLAVATCLMCFNGTMESSAIFSAALVSEEKCLPDVKNCIRTAQQADGITLVLRGCDSASFCDKPGCTSSPVDVCCCNSDWCNAAGTMRYQAITLLSVLLSLSLCGYLFVR